MIKYCTIFSIFILYQGQLSYGSEMEYFQQDVKYEIEVTLNDKDHSLSGFEISNSVSRNFLLGTFFFLFGYLLPLLYWVISPNYKNGQTSDKSDFLIDKKKYLSLVSVCYL